MTEKYLLFDLNDEKSKKLGEVISNSTARKIVNFLAEKESSETDISKELGLKLNTIEYNLKKLLLAGVIEKSKDFFWSKRGKKIDVYKVANKLLIISPKKTNVYSKLKSIFPVVLLSGIFTLFIVWMNKARQFVGVSKGAISEKAGMFATTTDVGNSVSRVGLDFVFDFTPLDWFLIGLWLAVILFVIWNFKKKS